MSVKFNFENNNSYEPENYLIIATNNNNKKFYVELTKNIEKKSFIEDIINRKSSISSTSSISLGGIRRLVDDTLLYVVTNNSYHYGDKYYFTVKRDDGKNHRIIKNIEGEPHVIVIGVTRNTREGPPPDYDWKKHNIKNAIPNTIIKDYKYFLTTIPERLLTDNIREFVDFL